MKNECKACKGTGFEICDNPDHGFIQAMSSVKSDKHDTGRLGCPGCGHDELHLTDSSCDKCNGTGIITAHQSEPRDETLLIPHPRIKIPLPLDGDHIANEDLAKAIAIDDILAEVDIYLQPKVKKKIQSLLASRSVDVEGCVEELADYSHSAWSGWMKYLFKICVENEDGTVTISKDSADRWQRQMEKLYKDLPESEKESDRKEARKMLKIISHLKPQVTLDMGGRKKLEDDLYEWKSIGDTIIEQVGENVYLHEILGRHFNSASFTLDVDRLAEALYRGKLLLSFNDPHARVLLEREKTNCIESYKALIVEHYKPCQKCEGLEKHNLELRCQVKLAKGIVEPQSQMIKEFKINKDNYISEMNFRRRQISELQSEIDRLKEELKK